MNNVRREELQRAYALLEEAKDIISFCCDEEQDAFDNMPEGFQQGERGEKMENNICCLENAVGNVETAMDEIEEAIF